MAREGMRVMRVLVAESGSVGKGDDIPGVARYLNDAGFEGPGFQRVLATLPAPAVCCGNLGGGRQSPGTAIHGAGPP